MQIVNFYNKKKNRIAYEHAYAQLLFFIIKECKILHCVATHITPYPQPKKKKEKVANYIILLQHYLYKTCFQSWHKSQQW